MMAPSIHVSDETWTIADMLWGVLPRVSRDRAFVLLAKLAGWGRGLGAGGELRHPMARKLLAGALGWRKDPDVLVEGLEAAGAVEVLPDGVRVRGVAPEARSTPAKPPPIAPEVEVSASIRAATAPQAKVARLPPIREPRKAPVRSDTVDGGIVDGPLGHAVEEAFLADRGRVFEWTAKERESVQRLLGNHDAPEILRRWRIGLQARYRKLSSLVDLERCWNEHAKAATEGPAKPEGLYVGRGELPTAAPVQQPDTPAGRTWSAAIERIREDGRTYAVQWLERLVAVSMTDDAIDLMASDTFHRAWLLDHYSGVLAEALAPRKPVLLVPDDGADRAMEAVCCR